MLAGVSGDSIMGLFPRLLGWMLATITQRPTESSPILVTSFDARCVWAVERRAFGLRRV